MFNAGTIIARVRMNTTEWRVGRRRLSDDLRTLGNEAAKLGAALNVATVGVLREYGTFDRAIREATAVTADLTSKQLARMSRMAEDASVRLNRSAQQSASAFYYLGSAGLSASEQMDAYNHTMNLSRALTEETSVAAEGLVDVMKAFEIPFTRAEGVVDTLVKTVTTSNQVFRDLDKALSYTGSTANLLNMSLANTTAVLGVMANAGIKGSMAGVALRRAVTNLMSPTAEMTRLMADLNIHLYDSTGAARPFNQVLYDISKRVQNTSERYRNMVFEILFGRRAIAGMIKVFDYGAEQLQAYTDSLNDAGGAAKEVTDRQMKAFLNQMGRIWQMTRRIVRSIGKQLAPSVQNLADLLGSKLTTLENWIEANGELVAKFTKLAAVTGAIMASLGALSLFMPGLIALFGALTAVVTNPFVLLIGSVYTLTVVFRDELSSLKDWIVTWLSSIKDAILQFRVSLPPWEDLIPGAKLLTTPIKYLFNYYDRAVEKRGPLYPGGVRHTGPPAFPDFSANMPDMPSITAPNMDGLKDKLSGLLGKFKTQVKEDAKNIAGALKNAFGKAFPGLSAQIDEFAAGIKDLMRIFSAGPEREFKRFADAAEQMDQIIANTQELTKKTKNFGNYALAPFAQAWQDASQQVIDNFTSITTGFQEMQSGIVDGWASAFERIMQEGFNLKNFFDDIWNAMYNQFVTFIARMAAQSLYLNTLGRAFGISPDITPATGSLGGFLSLLGPSGGPGGYGFMTPASAIGPAPSPRNYLGQFGAGKISMNINNQGPPMEAEVESVSLKDDELVLNAAFKLAKTNSQFRETFVNRR